MKNKSRLLIFSLIAAGTNVWASANLNVGSIRAKIDAPHGNIKIENGQIRIGADYQIEKFSDDEQNYVAKVSFKLIDGDPSCQREEFVLVNEDSAKGGRIEKSCSYSTLLSLVSEAKLCIRDLKNDYQDCVTDYGKVAATR